MWTGIRVGKDKDIGSRIDLCNRLNEIVHLFPTLRRDAGRHKANLVTGKPSSEAPKWLHGSVMVRRSDDENLKKGIDLPEDGLNVSLKLEVEALARNNYRNRRHPWFRSSREMFTNILKVADALKHAK